MDSDVPHIHLTMEEEILFTCITAACTKLRNENKYLEDLEGKNAEGDINFAMICGGWVRDKVIEAH